MSVHTRETSRGRRYDVRLRDATGKAYSRTFRTQTEAQDFERTELVARDRGEWVDPSARRRKLADVAEEWLASTPGKAPATMARDRRTLARHVLPTLGDRPISSIGPADLQKLVASWSAAGLMPRTVARNYGPLRATLLYAVNAGYLVRSPVRGVKLPTPEPATVRVLSPEELQAVVAAMAVVSPEYAPMVWIGAPLGLRWGEVAGLRVGAVDVLGRTLVVDQVVARGLTGVPYVKRSAKTAASHRTLAMPTALAELLAAHLKAVDLTAAAPDALLFPNEDGGPLWAPNFARRVWQPACVAAGVGLLEAVPPKPGAQPSRSTRYRYVGPGFHDLRRTSATALVVTGVDVKTAQYRLGHSSPMLTLQLYAQVVGEAERAAADRVGARLMGTA